LKGVNEGMKEGKVGCGGLQVRCYQICQISCHLQYRLTQCRHIIDHSVFSVVGCRRIFFLECIFAGKHRKKKKENILQYLLFKIYQIKINKSNDFHFNFYPKTRQRLQYVQRNKIIFCFEIFRVFNLSFPVQSSQILYHSPLVPFLPPLSFPSLSSAHFLSSAPFPFLPSPSLSSPPSPNLAVLRSFRIFTLFSSISPSSDYPIPLSTSFTPMCAVF
jgi:hypothetical protein